MHLDLAYQVFCQVPSVGKVRLKTYAAAVAPGRARQVVPAAAAGAALLLRPWRPLYKPVWAGPADRLGCCPASYVIYAPSSTSAGIGRQMQCCSVSWQRSSGTAAPSLQLALSLGTAALLAVLPSFD